MEPGLSVIVLFSVQYYLVSCEKKGVKTGDFNICYLQLCVISGSLPARGSLINI